MWGNSCSQWASWHLLDSHCEWMWGNGLLIFVEMMFSVQHKGREEENLSYWDNFETVCPTVRFSWAISEVPFSTAYQLSLGRTRNERVMEVNLQRPALLEKAAAKQSFMWLARSGARLRKSLWLQLAVACCRQTKAQPSAGWSIPSHRCVLAGTHPHPLGKCIHISAFPPELAPNLLQKDKQEGG